VLGVALVCVRRSCVSLRDRQGFGRYEWHVQTPLFEDPKILCNEHFKCKPFIHSAPTTDAVFRPTFCEAASYFGFARAERVSTGILLPHH
jgi:hypothetical protein